MPEWGDICQACWEIANSDQYWPSPEAGYAMYCDVCGEDTISVTVPQAVIDETNYVLTHADWRWRHDDECISQCPYGPDEKCRIGHGCTYCEEYQ